MLGVHAAVVEWESDQLLPAVVGITILGSTYLFLRVLEKRKHISPVRQLVYGGAVAGAVTVGSALFVDSTLGILLLSSMIVTYGVAGLAATLVDMLSRRRARLCKPAAPDTKAAPHPSVERTPDGAAQVKR
jgi:hypothetical protein